MPYLNLDDGLYLVRQRAVKNGMSLWHYGVLDIGNRLNLVSPPMHCEPMIIHQTPPQVRADPISSTGRWELNGKVEHPLEREAVSRINEALQNPSYDLFGHNCEHFA